MNVFEYVDILASADGSCGGVECHSSATCQATPRGFKCECNSGYQGDGALCSGEYFVSLIVTELQFLWLATSS